MNTVLDFWFNECSDKDWWVKDPQFDSFITDKFGALHRSSYRGELYHWRKTPEGRLAEIIILDQFSRNIYRDTPKAFMTDGMALILAQEMVFQNEAVKLEARMRSFAYMPYMHSESKIIHLDAVKLFSDPVFTSAQLDYELKHKAIIDRFDRYPHRNAILDRKSTNEEVMFLNTPGSSF